MNAMRTGISFGKTQQRLYLISKANCSQFCLCSVIKLPYAYLCTFFTCGFIRAEKREKAFFGRFLTVGQLEKVREKVLMLIPKSCRLEI